MFTFEALKINKRPSEFVLNVRCRLILALRCSDNVDDEVDGWQFECEFKNSDAFSARLCVNLVHNWNQFFPPFVGINCWSISCRQMFANSRISFACCHCCCCPIDTTNGKIRTTILISHEQNEPHKTSWRRKTKPFILSSFTVNEWAHQLRAQSCKWKWSLQLLLGFDSFVLEWHRLHDSKWLEGASSSSGVALVERRQVDKR